MPAKRLPIKNTPSSKKPAAPASGGQTATAATGDAGLRVRMYRVGFGDFFLLTIPGNPPQHILIDCGVTPGTTHAGDIGTIKDAVADMAKETNSRLALIIMTHRHMDHIIGFSRCADVFSKFKVDAIWMPYWESEYDDHAKKFQAELTAVALDVQQHLALSAGANPDVDDMLAMLHNATGVESAAPMAAAGTAAASKKTGTGGGSNAASLDLLKNKLGVKPEYYAHGDKATLPAALAATGLTAEILGPPRSDAADTFMKLTDLKKGVGQYLGAATVVGEGKIQPFDRPWRADATAYPASAFHEFVPRGGKGAPSFGNAELEAAVNAAQPEVLLTAVKSLDSFLNNQSLVVLFTFKGKKMLFVGDAQAGNWEYWMCGGTPTNLPSVDKITAEGKAILSNLDFYKVGHHGSTNATPIVAVETMGSDFAAMCSTQIGAYGNADKGTEVPRTPLLAALGKKSALVRSDQLQVTAAIGTVKPAEGTPTAIPKPARGKYVQGSIYVDYLF
jgi:beta-lactamase superfamily II metal-dependent hydrolase